MKVKNICCIGAGYVGGPTMAVIALKCPFLKVTVVDINPNKILAWNDKNLDNLPVFEPGLADVIKKTRGKNLFFSSEVEKTINESEMIFMAVNTPTITHGKGKGMAADLTYVESSAKTIAKASLSDKIVVEKSTLPVRTAEKIKEILIKNNNKVNFEVLSNPEFLAEGTAIKDLFKSDRVLIGGDSTETGQKAIKSLVNIYKQWIPESKILTTNIWSSELSKLASNAMLAQRISSINSLSALCEKTEADIDEVSRAIGMDNRIGKEFLKVSVGFGGSCFQKDILNLVYLCQNYGLNEVADYWHQVIKINDYQKNRFAKKIIKNIKGDVVTFFGWSFKKNTNDSRESAAIYVADHLLNEGYKLNVYDPMVDENRVFNDLKTLWNLREFSEIKISDLLRNINVFDNHHSALKNSNGIAILTEWEEFKNYDWNSFLDLMDSPIKIFDGRNILKNIYLNTSKFKLMSL